MDDDPIVPTGDDLDEDLTGPKLPEEDEEEDEDLTDEADESLN